MPEAAENRDRFERVIIPRVKRAVEAIALIGNGAVRNYETTPEEIAGLLAKVREALEAVEARYAKHLGSATTPTITPPSVEADTPPTRALAPAAGDWAGTLEAERSMHHHRVPMLADAVSDSFIAPLITHLINRLAEMAAASAA